MKKMFESQEFEQYQTKLIEIMSKTITTMRQQKKYENMEGAFELLNKVLRAPTKMVKDKTGELSKSIQWTEV